MIDQNERKSNGIYLTPPELAQFVATCGIHQADQTVLDPCFGEGALLSAAYSRLRTLGCVQPSQQLYGYEIEPSTVDHVVDLIGQDNVVIRDFLDVSPPDERLDTVIMNPPFVRHHAIPRDRIDRMRNGTAGASTLPRTSDLWAYFLVHAARFLRQEGSLVAILPWSLLRADYAKSVREFLMGRFRTIRVVVIGQMLFDGAEERVTVLIAEGFGSRASTICLGYSFGVPGSEIQWRAVSDDLWLESPWKAMVPSEVHDVFSFLVERLAFVPLKDVATIRIGVVTGDNGFFILEGEQSRTLGLPDSLLKPIVTSSRCLASLILRQDGVDDFLLCIPDSLDIPQTVSDYVCSGEKAGVHLKYHPKRRPKWYCINQCTAPDGFLPYMTKEVPYIVSNPDGLLSTNTVHGVDFNDTIDDSTKRRIQLSMLTSISQLSIELASRTYGGGVLKIEPSSAAGIFVSAEVGRSAPAHLEREIGALVSAGRRLDAVTRMDDWLTTSSRVTRAQMDLIRDCYDKMRRLRLSNRVEA